MDAALQSLRELAAGAIAHALISHHQTLGHDDITLAESILRRERDELGVDREMIAACYGAWLGQWAVNSLAANWIGLHEPAAPRLMIGTVICSPIDAMRRYLSGTTTDHTIAELVAQMKRWAMPEPTHSDATSSNQLAWDELASDSRFAGEMSLPPDRESAVAAIDPWLAAQWFVGCRLLCLGAGGGRQAPLHALAGAEVTVVDISERQLDHDREVAAKRGLSLRCVCQTAENLSGLANASFDFVLQPVSVCYLANVSAMYREVARVLRWGGIYVVQHKQPASLLAMFDGVDRYVINTPASQAMPLGVESRVTSPQRERGTQEFAHSLDTLIGSLCSAGFTITDFSEPPRADAFAPPGTAEHLARFLPPYFKLKSVRR